MASVREGLLKVPDLEALKVPDGEMLKVPAGEIWGDRLADIGSGNDRVKVEAGDNVDVKVSG